MNQNAPSKSREEEFNQAIDNAIVECSRETGITDLNTVDTYLLRAQPRLVSRIVKILGVRHRRIMIQKRLKRCAVSVREAADTAYREALQMEFNFFEMEQFRGVGHRITFPGEGKIQYVEYNRSLRAHRRASVAHLDTGIAADLARRQAEAAADAWLDPLVDRYGDLPAEVLVDKWLAEQSGGAAAGGVE